jgi:uncharacterized protein YbjT (DUF2867 family)
VDVQGNSNLARAGSESHVRHFLLISALWADRDLRPVIFRVKRQAEEAVIRSGLSYTILRPCTFAQGPSSLIGILGPTIERYGLAFVPAPDSRPISFMTIQDLVDAIVCIALNPAAHQHRILELGGAEPVTLIEGATRLAAILQKKLRVIRLPRSILSLMAVFAKRLGFGPYEAMLFLEMLRDHGFFCDAGPLRELLGREPQSLDTVLQEYYRQHRQTAWRDSIFGTLLLRAN